MKKQEVSPIELQIRFLKKKYKNIGRDYIRIIHQFCQYELKRTTKVMAIVAEMQQPMTVIEMLVKKPEKSEEIIAELQTKYFKLYGNKVEGMEMEIQEQGKVEEIQTLGFDFFQGIPPDTIFKVMAFLDPYSFFKMSAACKQFNQLSLSEAQADYYKILCTKLFSLEAPKLPLVCRFIPIRDYVLQRPQQYRPNTRNAVVNNLRNYIWKFDANSFHLGPSYYKNFGSYLSLYMQCPRIHFNGYYILRDKYVRIGIKDERNPIAPINVVYYYRYLRFLQDGTCLYHVRNKRLKPEQVSVYLSKELIEQNPKDTMIGEYIHFQNKLMVKAVQSRQVFSYEFEILSTKGQICNELRVQKYTLELIDDQQQILQTLYKMHPLKQKMSFNYCRSAQATKQNSPSVQATSL